MKFPFFHSFFKNIGLPIVKKRNPPKTLDEGGKENKKMVNLLLIEWNQKKQTTEGTNSTPDVVSPHYGINPTKLPSKPTKQNSKLGPGGMQSNKTKTWLGVNTHKYLYYNMKKRNFS